MRKTKNLILEEPIASTDPAQLSLEMERAEDASLSRAKVEKTLITREALNKVHDLLDHLDTDPAWREVVAEYRTMLPERNHA